MDLRMLDEVMPVVFKMGVGGTLCVTVSCQHTYRALNIRRFLQRNTLILLAKRNTQEYVTITSQLIAVSID